MFELYYPVGLANELGPALHAIHSIGVDRLPSWTHWFPSEFHVRLSRSAVSLFRIAIDASQNTVRPGRQATLSTRDHVVNREFFAARLLSTVLAAHLVTLENVSAAECNLLRRHRIELGQCDDFRNTDTLAYRLDERLVAIWYKPAPIAPVVQLVIHWINDLGRVVPQHDQGTRNRRHVDRLPVTVQHQRWSLKRRAQSNMGSVIVEGCCNRAHG
jgi:hypothetical protein